MISLEKIPFKDFKEPALAEEILMALQDNIENAINNKNIMTREIDRQNITISKPWEASIVNLSTVSNTGEKIVSVENGIKIGKNVEQVLIGCTIQGIGHGEVVGDKDVCIKKNNEQIANFYQSAGVVETGYAGATIAPKLANVSEGDVFSVTVSSRRYRNL